MNRRRGLPLLLTATVCAGLGIAHAQGTPPAATSPGLRATIELPPVVHISGGWFERGSTEQDFRRALHLCAFRVTGGTSDQCQASLLAERMPPERVYVSPFGIDRTEVTWAAYRRCVADGACTPPSLTDGDPRLAQDAHPVAGVTFAQAEAYCRHAGGRLPTETEWERAARGPARRYFPWGQLYNDRLANHGRPPMAPDPVDGFDYAAPVGSFPDGASYDGLLDMAGNVWEWTRDRFQLGYVDPVLVDPTGPRTGGERIVRGGSWRTPPHYLRAAQRLPVAEGAAWPDVGFRCVYAPEPPPSPLGGAVVRPAVGPRAAAVGQGTDGAEDDEEGGEGEDADGAPETGEVEAGR